MQPTLEKSENTRTLLELPVSCMGSMRQTLMINIILLLIYERETKVGFVLHCGLNFQERRKKSENTLAGGI